MSVFDIITILIACSMLFIFINTVFLKLPSFIGLMILALILSGLVLAFGSLFPEYHLAEKVKEFDFSEVMYRFVLSVMLFAGALNVDFKKMGRQLVPIMVLTLSGVLISTFTIGTLMYAIVSLLSIELSYLASLVFGALISCTDPIAITKNIKRFNLSNALDTKVTGESLLNGGFSIVLAFTLMNIYQEQNALGVASFLDVSILVIRDWVGGIIVGVLFGWIGLKVLKFVDNDRVEAEVLITMALVMGSSYLADLLAVSSMLVAVLTGLIVGNFGREENNGERAVGKYVYRFWQLMEESLAAILFVLIGFEMLVIPLRLDYFAGGFFAVVVVLFSRWLSMFIPIRLMSKSRSFDNATISVLTWGALRGGLPVAFTLSLANFPGKEILLTFTYVVVVCSVLYQGLTLGSVMKLYKEQNEDEGENGNEIKLKTEKSQSQRSAA
jgi:monovalent cation:H+ antiporter, CPA1 family